MAATSGDKDIDLRQSLIPDGVIRTTATSISSGAIVPLTASPLSARCRVYVLTTNTVGVYVGTSTVTASDGFPLVRNVPLPIPVTDAIVIYATADGPTSIRVLELA